MVLGTKQGDIDKRSGLGSFGPLLSEGEIRPSIPGMERKSQ